VIEAPIAVGIARKFPKCGEQLSVCPRRRNSGCRQQIGVVHQHLGIRFPRHRVDAAVRQPQRAEHCAGRSLRETRGGRNEIVQPHHAACTHKSREKRRRDIGADVRRRAGDDGGEQNFFSRSPGRQWLHTDLNVGVLTIPLVGEAGGK
jgi:hypothetical protein